MMTIGKRMDWAARMFDFVTIESAGGPDNLFKLVGHKDSLEAFGIGGNLEDAYDSLIGAGIDYYTGS